MVVADSSAGWAAALLFWVGLVIFPAAVNFAKGKFWWGLLTFLGFLWIFGVCAAIRLAKPDSWWARKLYDERTMARARERFA
jgi:hypothetical protein